MILEHRTSQIIPGHKLIAKGAPHGSNGKPTKLHSPRVHVGRAKCECGVLSPILGSWADRRDWHQAHKYEVLRRKAAVVQADDE